MGIHRGPNIIIDGLVFGYDTGYGIADNETTTRFYPGEPTTNEFYGSGSNGNILDHASGYGGYGTAQTGALDAFGTTENTVYRNTGKMRLGPTGGQDIGTLTNGNTYTFSIYLRHVPGENNVPGSNGFEFDIVDNAGGATYDFSGNVASNMTYDWKRFAVTSTHSNNANYRFLDVGTYQGTNVWEWCMPQIEVGSHATPYTRTSRSSTVSLIDLKRTLNVDLSNAGFDSTGQPITDGTDDYIAIDGSGSLNFGVNDSFTIETVVKLLAIPTSGNTSSICCKSFCVGIDWYYPSATGLKFRYGIRNSTNGQQSSESSVVDLNKWYHVVFTYEPGSSTGMKLYVNGEHQSSRSNSGFSEFANSSNDFYIGSNAALGGGPNQSSIQSAIVKMYNKTLTADEVKQNYNAYKSRFNI